VRQQLENLQSSLTFASMVMIYTKKIEDFQTWIMNQYEYEPTKLRIEAND
jgi:hypothetical protein